MLKFTLDTNTLISAVISKGNEYQLLKLAKEGSIKIVLSLDIIKEFKEVISREKFGFSKKQIDNVVKQILNICELIIPTIRLSIIEDDPDDDRILECAVTGNADYMVSGDRHLLNLNKYGKISIIRTFEALKIIDKQE